MKTVPSSIAEVLNKITPSTIRWCTPSIIQNLEIVKNPYESDMSVSFECLGFPAEPSGIFLESYQRAAKVYGAERTVFSVNGSTGGNFIVLRTLFKQISKLRILSLRNIHKSILNACQDYGINLHFIDAVFDKKLHFFLPPSIEEIVQNVIKIKPHVLLLTNPTYEGLSLNLKLLVQKIREVDSKIIIFVDEAWGAHLGFSELLPPSAMQCGADVCVQSTHKQGGSLQQGGMIHWNESRIDSAKLLESYRNLSTTSPSYLLLASLDATASYMREYGKEKIHNTISIAQEFERQLNLIPGCSTVRLEDTNDLAVSDQTKIILDVSNSGLSGFEVAKVLEDDYRIIVEKSSISTLLFLVPFQSSYKDVKMTIKALKKIFYSPINSKIFSEIEKNTINFPLEFRKILDMNEVVQLNGDQIETIPLEKANGRIAAENITPYPPGVPMTIQGEEITQEAIAFYDEIRKYPNSHILATDATLNIIKVVK